MELVDTSFGYPDMRKLMVKKATAFLIVLAVDNVVSFKHVHTASLQTRLQPLPGA